MRAPRRCSPSGASRRAECGPDARFGDARGRGSAGDRASLRSGLGANHGIRVAAPDRRGARRDRGVRARRRRSDRARRDRAGEVRQQPQRAARDGSGCTSKTTPSRTTSTTWTRRAGSWPSSTTAGGARDGDLLARVHAACLYRARRSPRATGRGSSRAPTRPPRPRAPLIATAEHGDGRVVVLADSDLFGDDCIERARPPRAVAEPRVIGPPARPRGRTEAWRRGTRARCSGSGMDGAAGRDQRARAAAGAGRVASPRRGPTRRERPRGADHRGDRRRSAPVPAPGRLPEMRS